MKLKGIFKLWNVQRSSSFTVVKTFTWASTMSRVHLRAFEVVHPTRNIVTGSCRLHVFKLHRIKEEKFMPLLSFYTKFSNQFITITTSRVSVTDGSTGDMVEERDRIHESGITHCCHDLLGKKIILATESGSVVVYNSANFTKIRENTKIGQMISIMYSGPEKVIIAGTVDGR